MIVYPKIDPVLVTLGPVQVHWYGLMYLVGFLSAWWLARYRVKRLSLKWTDDDISDLIFYFALGAIAGGRVGYMLFYNFTQFKQAPWTLFAIWEGGMSFHGGLLGVILALFLFARKQKRPFWDIADFVAPLVPLGLGAGRIGNFINGELWGRITDVPWGMVFPHVDVYPRHPSQLYEFLIEGLLLFIIVWCFALKPRPRMAVSGLFLLCYGVGRFFIEFFRVPDSQLGYLAFDWFTMGQLLSLPMIIAGVAFLTKAYCRVEGGVQS